MRKKIRLFIMCMLCCFFMIGCEQTSEKGEVKKETIGEKNDNSNSQVSEGKEEDAKEKIDSIGKKASECNYNTENYLFFDEEKEISLYFSINMSKLDIKRLDLYEGNELVYENVTIEKCYDNIIKVLVKEYIPYFDYIKLYDSMGEEMEVYVGKHFLEEHNSYNEIKYSLDVSSKVIDSKWKEKMKFLVSKENLKKYDVEMVLPSSVRKMFECKRTEKKQGKDVAIMIDLTLKERYKKLKQITFEADIIQTEKKTGLKNSLYMMYIPMIEEK